MRCKEGIGHGYRKEPAYLTTLENRYISSIPKFI